MCCRFCGCLVEWASFDFGSTRCTGCGAENAQKPADSEDFENEGQGGES